MRHDEAFKLLLSACPGDILPVFAPELAELIGPPEALSVESVELLPRIPGMRRSRFLDFAVSLRWPGGRAVLILTEHFSRPDGVDLRRVALYTAALMHRHPDRQVLPVAVVGRTRGRSLDGRLLSEVGGAIVLDFRCRIFHLDRDCLPAWDRTRSPVLAVLSALLRDQPQVQVAYRAVQQLRRSRDGLRLMAVLLPLVEHLASLDADARAIFHHLISETPDMISVVDMFRAEGEAKGKAAGKAEGILAVIRGLLADGDITVDQARNRIVHLQRDGVLSDQQASAALSQIG
jgi:hypothetical protein